MGDLWRLVGGRVGCQDLVLALILRRTDADADADADTVADGPLRTNARVILATGREPYC